MLQTKHDVSIGHLSIQEFVINCGVDIFLITFTHGILCLAGLNCHACICVTFFSMAHGHLYISFPKVRFLEVSQPSIVYGAEQNKSCHVKEHEKMCLKMVLEVVCTFVRGH